MGRGWRKLLPGSKKPTKSDPTPSSAEGEYHPSPLTNTKQFPAADDVHTKLDHEHPQATKGYLVSVPSALPTIAETQLQIAEEPAEMDRESQESPVLVSPIQTNQKRHSIRRFFGEENRQTTPGSSQVSDNSPAMVNIKELKTDDIVIAVMGPTGSGKSMFIRCASGHETQGVGHTLKSFTSQVLGIRFWDEESKQHVVLVDTPGFDDTFKSDLDILNMISEWLNSSYNNDKLLSGILYLHRITDNRMAGTPLKNLRVFRKLCGKDALEKVYLTTTMWDEVEPTVGKRRLDELSSDYWKVMLSQGAHIARCRSDDDSPKQLIRSILTQEGTRKVLLQEEMVELGKELRETAAGQQLYSQLELLVERQTELLRRINKERKAASDPNVLVELQAEYDDLRAQVDDKLRQMAELKLPRLTRFFRLFALRQD